jgi:hypothetical protein
MCGCGNTTTTSTYTGSTGTSQVTASADCTITPQMLEAWKTNLKCIAQNSLFDQAGIDFATYNRMMGTVQSGLNWRTNYCYFEHQLQEVLIAMPQISQVCSSIEQT